MPDTVDEYIAGFEPDVQEILQNVRLAIHRGVPGADEKIRYGMAAVMLGGRYAIHIGGWKKHVGLYPVPRFEGALEEAIAPYRSEKDSVTFRYADEVPYDLIQRVAEAIAAQRSPV
ncbi:iron chaperone [Cellulomonas sp. PhB150]|uniref:iron chaperone n=1 Tax=Cellulomonas sp. PhB150 TaxID=2485188 RepID=UPI000F463EBB|nr:DUF1801 domain-containing protein [Cellulomonas sp. PhB150]ROS27921.1 uncharacterized protein YdhG (YjbR/CyaY superfamily) [Cellulomonas sp. PhB150]